MAIGAVVILVCLLFPLFRVSKEGVQWTKELEEELTNFSGEVTGEEINDFIKEESLRWSLVYQWLKMTNAGRLQPQFLLSELLTTIWDVYPAKKVSLILSEQDQKWGIVHPLLVKLEPVNLHEIDIIFGIKLKFGEQTYLLLHVYGEPESLSLIDEKFIFALERSSCTS